jgi:hypothetical protein
LYRFGILASGWQRPCPCLGNIADAIRQSAKIADLVSEAFLPACWKLRISFCPIFIKFK